MLDSMLELNFIVVIRSVDERTFGACRELVLKQIPASSLHVVSEFPFEQTLRKCYKIGMESQVKWMVTLDADILLRESAIADLLVEAERLPENYFQLEGLVFDKLTGIYRKAGHRVYRVSCLKLAMQQIPEDKEEIRPEYTTIQRMEKLGYKSYLVNKAFGIHDYEQYYADIYRKAFVHANKHQNWLVDFITRWKELASNDSDYKIALKGLSDGLISSNVARIDARDYTGGSKKAMLELELKEKPSFVFCATLPSQIEDVLIHVGPVSIEKPPSFEHKMKRLKGRYDQLGGIRFVVFIVGSLLYYLGKEIKEYVQLKE